MDCWQSFSYLLFSKVLACTVWSSRFSGGGGEEPPEDRCSLSSWCTILMVSETPSFCCVGGGTGARGAPAGFGGLGGFGAVTGAGLGATSGAGAGACTGAGAGTVSGAGAGTGTCDGGAWGTGSGTGSGSAWKAMIFSSGWGAGAAGGGATTCLWRDNWLRLILRSRILNNSAFRRIKTDTGVLFRWNTRVERN